MKPYDNYAQLELLSTHSTDSLLYPPAPKSTQPTTASTRLGTRVAIAARQLATACVRFLAGSSEPTIRRKCDRNGELYFMIHDPISGKAHRCSTEQEVRAWLDGRYNA